MTYLREKPEVVCRECEHTIMHWQAEKEWECSAPANTTDAGWSTLTGSKMINRALCRVANHDGKCQHFEPRNEGVEEAG